MNQPNLCDEGRRCREKFWSINDTMPLLEREGIIWMYFRHKRDCPHCDLTWRKDNQ